jgi:hypothetical protein
MLERILRKDEKFKNINKLIWPARSHKVQAVRLYGDPVNRIMAWLEVITFLETIPSIKIDYLGTRPIHMLLIRCGALYFKRIIDGFSPGRLKFNPREVQLILWWIK